MPLKGLIKVKEVIFRVTVPSHVQLSQLHGIQIYDSHEIGVFFDYISSKDQNTRGGELVEAWPQGEFKGLCFIKFHL
jgi:hypothetical protein